MKTDPVKQNGTDDGHMLHLPQPFKFSVNADYDYLRKKPWQTVKYFIVKFLADAVMNIWARVAFGLQIEGRENLRGLKGGAVVICNHVHPFDCTFIDIIFPFRRLYYATLESNFKIPIARRLMRALGGIPMPKKVSGLKHFKKAVDEALQSGKLVCIYPEGVLYPYYAGELRRFRDGAFRIAADNNKPIIPLVVTFRKPRGLFKLYKAYPCVTITVLPPVIPEPSADGLLDKCFRVMNERATDRLSE